MSSVGSDGSRRPSAGSDGSRRPSESELSCKNDAAMVLSKLQCEISRLSLHDVERLSAWLDTVVNTKRLARLEVLDRLVALVEMPVPDAMPPRTPEDQEALAEIIEFKRQFHTDLQAAVADARRKWGLAAVLGTPSEGRTTAASSTTLTSACPEVAGGVDNGPLFKKARAQPSSPTSPMTPPLSTAVHREQHDLDNRRGIDNFCALTAAWKEQRDRGDPESCSSVGY